MVSARTAAGLVTAQMHEQYHEEGYFIIERALDDEQLESLRGGARFAMDRADRKMDDAGVDKLNYCIRGKRYFMPMIYKDRPELRDVLFSDTMAQICRAVLGSTAYLFWEQYVIKGPDPDTAFSWHQDSGYVHHEDHQPYLTCWIPLDDVTEDNGTVYLLPYSRSGIRTYIAHRPGPRGTDQVCYFGSDPGIPVVVPAGSIACFSSVVIHRSSINQTDGIRRVYLAQYSPEVIMTKDGSKPMGSFEPFLLDGAIAPEHRTSATA